MFKHTRFRGVSEGTVKTGTLDARGAEAVGTDSRSECLEVGMPALTSDEPISSYTNVSSARGG